jgi:hypothetical protein
MANDAQYKNSRRVHFDVFQDYRREMFGNGGKPKSHKGSPTIPDNRQGNLF